MKKNKASTTVSHVFLFYWNNAKIRTIVADLTNVLTLFYVTMPMESWSKWLLFKRQVSNFVNIYRGYILNVKKQQISNTHNPPPGNLPPFLCWALGTITSTQLKLKQQSTGRHVTILLETLSLILDKPDIVLTP